MKTGKRHKKEASAILEYMALTLFLLLAFLISEKYILRGLAGRWVTFGDVIGSRKQYDPRDEGEEGAGGGSLECWSRGLNYPVWINKRCFDKKCDCTLPPEAPTYKKKCTSCVSDCVPAVFRGCKDLAI